MLSFEILHILYPCGVIYYCVKGSQKLANHDDLYQMIFFDKKSSTPGGYTMHPFSRNSGGRHLPLATPFHYTSVLV